MAGAPKGNKNALKHGLFAKKAIRGEIVEASDAALAPTRAEEAREGLETTIRYLKGVMDVIYMKMKRAKGEEYARLATTLSLVATAYFNGQRTAAYLMGGISVVDEAVKELRSLEFQED